MITEAISFASNLLTIIASGIAIYLFATKRNEIGSAFKVLINYAYQTTLAELNQKLERLNEYNANEPSEIDEIRNILNEIAGQIRGNSRLSEHAPNLANRFEALAVSKKLTEPSKRSITSELREVLRNVNIDSFEEIMRKEK